MNPTISTGNKDPRIPYYWANQLTPGQFPRDNGNLDTGDPRADYWDANTGFFSNRFGSIGPNRDGSVETDATGFLNMRVGAEWDEFTLSLFGRNLTNEKRPNIVQLISVESFSTQTRLRSVGVSLSYRF